MSELTLEYVQRIADQKGLKVGWSERWEAYGVMERNPNARGTTFWMAKTLQEVLDGLERELPRREWREADEASMWAWLEAEGKEAMRAAGIEWGDPSGNCRDWWEKTGKHLQRDWAYRNGDAIARWRADNMDNEDNDDE